MLSSDFEATWACVHDHEYSTHATHAHACSCSAVTASLQSIDDQNLIGCIEKPAQGLQVIVYKIIAGSQTSTDVQTTKKFECHQIADSEAAARIDEHIQNFFESVENPNAKKKESVD